MPRVIVEHFAASDQVRVLAAMQPKDVFEFGTLFQGLDDEKTLWVATSVIEPCESIPTRRVELDLYYAGALYLKLAAEVDLTKQSVNWSMQ